MCKSGAACGCGGGKGGTAAVAVVAAAILAVCVTAAELAADLALILGAVVVTALAVGGVALLAIRPLQRHMIMAWNPRQAGAVTVRAVAAVAAAPEEWPRPLPPKIVRGEIER